MTVATGPRLSRRISEGVFLVFCWIATLVAVLALAAILWSLLSQGIGGLDLNIFTKSTPAPGSVGGYSRPDSSRIGRARFDMSSSP